MVPLMLAAMAGGTALKMFGQIAGGMNAQKMAKMQETINRQNADVMMKQVPLYDNQSQYALQRGALNETRLGGEIDTLSAKQSVAAVASNLDDNFGSPLAFQVESALQGEVDRGLIRSGAGIESANALVGKANMIGGAVDQLRAGAQAKWQGNAALAAGYIGAATTMLSGISEMAKVK